MTREHDGCTVLRRMRIRHSNIDLRSGEVEEGGFEWVTRACNTPLFGADRKIGVCRSCRSGWTHPHNYPVAETNA